ncbi:GDP-mannose 4,6-dehydratase [Lysobacter antibioticus]|uniref:GDP-mannose 4,6-dehydratase n=1 Tax=Lysobacter antibioticus TaxID=84531 RepID=UPI00034C6FEB|nr:GDP-mannose 4,6-dehydratase [Lysobacter antibioticus]
MSAAKRLLVTGATGFVGEHVRLACVAGGAFSGWEFCPAPKGWNILEAERVKALVSEVRPDGVLHLAAQSFVPRSFEAPRETLEVNLMGTLNLLQALSATGFKGRMIYVSSGDVYGRVADESLPVDESTPVAPRSPYAVSKVAAEHLCLQWQRSEGLEAMIARPFNHVGPGQDARFVLPALARQVAEIESGRKSPVIDAGDIYATRDFTDVRDVVAAYAAMLASGVAGQTYLIASGRERRVRDLLDAMCDLAGVSPQIRQDPDKLRPAEQRRMVADAGLLRRDTGWMPRIALENTLLDILNDARNKL